MPSSRQKALAATRHIQATESVCFREPSSGHVVKACYCYPDLVRTPFINVSYQLTHAQDDSLIYQGKTDAKGHLKESVDEPGIYTLAFLPEKDALAEQRLTELHNEIDQALNSLLLNDQQALKNQLCSIPLFLTSCKKLPYLGAYLDFFTDPGLSHNPERAIPQPLNTFLEYQNLTSEIMAQMNSASFDIWPDFSLANIDKLQAKLIHNQEAQLNYFSVNYTTLNRLNLLVRDGYLMQTLTNFPDHYWQGIGDINDNLNLPTPVASLGLDIIIRVICDAIEPWEEQAEKTVPAIAPQSNELIQEITTLTAEAIDVLQKIKPRKQLKISVNKEHHCYANPLLTTQLAINHFDSTGDTANVGDNVIDAKGHYDIDEYHHVKLLSGELVVSTEDFVLHEPLPLHWQRYYRSHNTEDQGLGVGWSHPFGERLWIDQGHCFYLNAQACIIKLPLPNIGEFSTNEVEKVYLYRDDSRFFMIKASGKAHRLFDSKHNLRLYGIADDFGNAWQCHYHQDQLHSIQSNWGTKLELSYRNQQLTEIHRVQKNHRRLCLAQYEYQTQHLVHASGSYHNQQADYDYRGYLLSDQRIHRADGIEYRYGFTWENNRCTSCSTPDGNTYLLNWCLNSNSLMILSNNKPIGQFRYNPLGLVLEHQDKSSLSANYHYSTKHQVKLIAFSDGRLRQYEYDKWGNRSCYSDEAGGGYSVIFNEQQRPILFSDSLGNTWELNYNERQQLETCTEPNGITTHYHYGGNGLPELQTNSEGETIRYEWDSQGLLISKTLQQTENAYGAPVITHFEYDDLNRIAYAYQQDAWVRVEYCHAEIKKLVHSNGYAIHISHSDNAVSVYVSFNNQNSWRFHYRDGYLIGLEGAQESFVELEYDDKHHLIGVRDNQGHHYTQQYDSEDQLAHIMMADGTCYDLYFDAAGYLCRSDWVKHQQNTISSTTWSRDLAGRLVKMHSDIDGPTSVNYNALGQIIEISSNDRSCHFTYDETGTLQGNSRTSAQTIDRLLSPMAAQETNLAGQVCAFWLASYGKQKRGEQLIQYPYQYWLDEYLHPASMGHVKDPMALAGQHTLPLHIHKRVPGSHPFHLPLLLAMPHAMSHVLPLYNALRTDT